MSLTAHARKRLQQRGITDFFVDVLLDFGTSQKSHGGSEIVFLTHHDKRLAEGSNCDGKTLRRLRNAYLILSRSGKVITAGYRYRPIKTL
jgi:hypothetical protein